ncbi:alanine--tRNA ligase [Candidatus Neomarinimicrobiota bacterium]
MKTGKEIRQEFISFFEAKEHRFIRSSPVVPHDDPTLLFTNAGMNQFKPIFLDQQKPGYTRAVNTQKCIRVSGKHNDLEEVGVDVYHHTFFEMLGNWSFGDYYKAEAIKWAWELFTEVWGIDKNRLWATVYQSDDEAAELWPQMTDIPPERVLRFGAKENFWEMGDTGPCGPCSEIHYYDGPDLGAMNAEGVNAEAEYKELWNLVFIQNNRLPDGSLEDLPAKHVDTGAGFERIVAVLQGKTSNYDTDLFTPIIEHIAQLTGIPYDGENGIAHRVIADHIRMLSFSLADGAMPGNEGRGYVVRRILRRGARFGRMLEQHTPFIYRLVDTVCDVMGEAFPEIIEKRSHIEKVIQAEESAFGDTLDRGLEIFDKVARQLQTGDVIPGEEVFRLYDTYGFPLDLTELMAREKGLTVDTEGFEQAMTQQRERARVAGKTIAEEEKGDWTTITEGSSSEFNGYTQSRSAVSIRKYREYGEGESEIILDKTPFYAESGGQIGDTGIIKSTDLTFRVNDTRKILDEGHEEIVHQGVVEQGSLGAGAQITAVVDQERRQSIRNNHTATHLLHKALKIVLGEHVQQAGSLVAPDRLRFDFTHYEKVNNDQIAEIGSIVNQRIQDDIQLNASIQDYEAARQGGAEAIFGEKYGDRVRVIDIPGFSRELCGGTHVDRTADIGAFKITSESAVAAGVRRMEAVTGNGVLEFLRDQITNLVDELHRESEKHQDLIQQLDEPDPDKDAPDSPERAGEVESFGLRDIDKLENIVTLLKQDISRYHELNKQLAREIKKQRKQVSRADVLTSLQIEEIPPVKVGFGTVTVHDQDEFKDLAVDVKHRLKSAVVALGAEIDNKLAVVVAVTEDLKDRIHAGQLANELGKELGGGGGGSAILATAGGKDPSLLEDVLQKVPAIVKKRLQAEND